MYCLIITCSAKIDHGLVYWKWWKRSPWYKPQAFFIWCCNLGGKIATPIVDLFCPLGIQPHCSWFFVVQAIVLKQFPGEFWVLCNLIFLEIWKLFLAIFRNLPLFGNVCKWHKLCCLCNEACLPIFQKSTLM